MEAIVRHNDAEIDQLELAMFEAASNPESNIRFIDCPNNHLFYPGLYVRQILMPQSKEGTLITSEVHNTCHPFRVLQGIVWVKIDSGEWERIEAPYEGTTLPNTRRVLAIEKDTVWETFHALPFIKGDEGELSQDEMMKVVDKIKDTIIEPYENKLLGGTVFLNQITNVKSIAE